MKYKNIDNTTVQQNSEKYEEIWFIFKFLTFNSFILTFTRKELKYKIEVNVYVHTLNILNFQEQI